MLDAIARLAKGCPIAVTSLILVFLAACSSSITSAASAQQAETTHNARPTQVHSPSSPMDPLTFGNDIEITPLSDPLLAIFPREWDGPGSKPWGLAFDPALFDRTPVTDRWDEGLIRFEADPGSEWVGAFFKLGNLDLERYRHNCLALRCKYSDQMFRRFKVELKRNDGMAAVWIVDLNNEEIASFKQLGFGDILLPLNDADRLADCTELVFVWESSRAKTVAGNGTAGNLLLHSIRVTEPPGATIEPSEQIDALAQRGFDWFEHYRNETSGLVPDRAPNRLTLGITKQSDLTCSIASVGYCLSLIPDAVDTGRLTQEEAEDRVLTVLRFIEANAEHHNGLLYHFMDMETGKAASSEVEISALDSSIF